MANGHYLAGFFAGLVAVVCVSGCWVIFFKLVRKVKNVPRVTSFGTIAVAWIVALLWILVVLRNKGGQTELMTWGLFGAVVGAIGMTMRFMPDYRKARQRQVSDQRAG